MSQEANFFNKNCTLVRNCIKITVIQLQNEGPAGASITVWGLEGDGLEFKQSKASLQGIASER